MRTRIWLTIITCGAFAAAISGRTAAQNAQAQSASSTANANGKFVVFDAPGTGVGTFPNWINNEGIVIGSYNDANQFSHGFAKVFGCESEWSSPTCNGGIITLDAPGAGNTGILQGTWALNMDRSGVVVGYYTDNSSLSHGALWYPSCAHRTCTMSFTSFDEPNAGNARYFGTNPEGINAHGTIIGYYYPANLYQTGFLATPKCPGPHGTGSCQLTFTEPGFVPFYINDRGGITGEQCTLGVGCTDFVRSPDGTVTQLPLPFSTDELFITGIGWTDAVIGIACHYLGTCIGFMHNPDGTYTSLGQYTSPVSINRRNAVTGNYPDQNNVAAGFLRSADGSIQSFTPPGAVHGTYPQSINDRDWITGYFYDASDTPHGFIWFPPREHEQHEHD